MGAPVEGWSREKIEAKYGLLDRFVPYSSQDWDRAAGTTEDGIERQKILATAIIEKQDRVRADDLLNTWLRDYDPATMRFKQEGFDMILLELVRAGLPPSDLGAQNPFQNLISIARAFHPIGLINAGSPADAADDIYEVGRVYTPENSHALRWAALYTAALAEACRPGASVESVLKTARAFATYRAPRRGVVASLDAIAYEVDRALEIAARSRSVKELMEGFDAIYNGGSYLWYSISMANEIVSKGLGIFAFTKGDARASIVAAVNFGRDTDCLGAIAGGLAGTYAGGGGIPPEWIRQVDEATHLDPYTNNRRTIAETADGLLAAFRARQRRLQEHIRALSEIDPAGRSERESA